MQRLRKVVPATRVIAVLLAFCLVFGGTFANAMAKTGKTPQVKSVSLKIGNETVTKKTYKMNQSDKKKIKVSVSPGKAKKTVQYTSSNKKIAAVNKSGMVTAKEAGTAKITVTVNAKKSTWVKIKVVVKSAAEQPDETEIPEESAPPSVTETPIQTETPVPTEIPDVSGNKQSIVIYFSCTDNTKTIAEYVAETTDADIYRIEPSVPYTSSDLNYGNTDSRTSKEQNDDTARPEIAGELPSLDRYDYVYLGYPIWWGQAPKIMYTYVESCNLSEKTVIPFCTSASSGIGTSATNLQAADVNHGTWLSGRRFAGSSPKSDVESWISGLGLQ